jgi:N-carbamoylputrescine amidase
LDECEGHAVANGLYVAAANRIGLEQYYLIQQELNFGEPPSSWTTRRNFGASLTTKRILIAEVDLDLENVRQNWPFFRDRRIDALETLLKEHLIMTTNNRRSPGMGKPTRYFTLFPS